MADYITSGEAAKRLGISQSRVLVLLKSGRLSAKKIGMQWMILPKDLAAVRVRKPGRPRKG